MIHNVLKLSFCDFLDLEIILIPKFCVLTYSTFTKTLLPIRHLQFIGHLILFNKYWVSQKEATV